jgi:outer membrane lipoprotein-sorting protein
MRFFSERPALRWLAPLALVLVVGGAGLVATTATADPKLPPRTAQQLLVDLQQAKVDGLSGTVTQQANLGLPELPAGGSRSSDFNSLISGSHTLKVWYAGPDKARVALLGTLGESDLIVNGNDVWTWSSDSNEASHRTIDKGARDRAGNSARRQAPTDLPKTPQEAAERFLAAVGPTTEVATDSHVTVAGRAAYELVLQPRDDRSLITQVRIAVDAEKKVPLRVQVYGQGSDPVAAVGFTAVDFTVPDDGQFAFNPPPGTKVTEVKPDQDAARKDAAEKKADQARQQRGDSDTSVIGTGWTTVVVTEVDDDQAGRSGSDQGQLGALLEQLPKTSGDWGSGRVLAGTAFSAVLTDDGRLAVGTVKPAVLYDALKR